MRSFLAGLLVLVSGTASADIGDGKPWDWKTLESIMLRNKNHDGTCDGVAEESEYPNLVCTLDHKSWDDHLAKESKIERIRDRNQQQPSNCGEGAFQFFRQESPRGGYPTNSPTETGAVHAEFRAKVATLACRFDDVEKDAFVTYDAKTKTLVFHMTRKLTSNPDWITDQLRTPAMQKVFPELNKWWRAHE